MNKDISIKLPRETPVEYYKRVRFVLEERIKEPERRLCLQSVTRSGCRGGCEKCGTETNWLIETGGRFAYWCGCD